MSRRLRLKRAVKMLPVGLTEEDFDEIQELYFEQVKKKPKITLRRAKSKSTWRERWERKPSAALAEKAASKLLEEESPEWDAVSLLGLFFLRYKSWCNAPYRDGSLQMNLLLMESVVEDVGPEAAYKGVEVLFDRPMDWVSGKTISFLADPKKWSRFVAPAIAQKDKKGKSRGEQSEFKRKASEDFVVRRKR